MIKVKVENLKKSFGSLEVLKDINMEVKEGEVVCLIGPSGSGKSTFLRCLNKLEEPTGGVIIVDDYDLMAKTSDINKIRENIGMVFQQFNLFSHLSVLQNIMLAPVDRKRMTKEQAEEKAKKLLDRVGLLEKADVYPASLSGGQQQRVAIARAIALNPQYLFCDEPNSGLDPKTSLVIDELIHDITTEYNMTTIINTHDMNSVMGIGDSILYIYQGHKEWEGTKDDVFTATNERLNNFIFASDLLRKVREVEEHRK